MSRQKIDWEQVLADVREANWQLDLAGSPYQWNAYEEGDLGCMHLCVVNDEGEAGEEIFDGYLLIGATVEALVAFATHYVK